MSKQQLDAIDVTVRAEPFWTRPTRPSTRSSGSSGGTSD